jgi:hypothetical protein
VVDTTQTTDNAAQAQNTASTPTQTGAANPGSTEAKFTQADVDRILKEKLEKAPEREARIKAELLKQLGLAEDADFNTLKSTIDKAREIETANLSAVEKAEKVATDALKRAEAAEQKALTIEAERRNDRIASHLLAEASKLKATDAETVLLYARDKHKAELDAIMGEDGALDEGKTKKLLETIKTAKPVYFQAVIQGAGVPSNAGGRAIPSDAEAFKRASMTNQRIIRG